MASRILIIDDNVSLARNLRDVLEGAKELDVEVELAPDGQKGVSAAKREAFDVAVVDVKLPDASGVDLIRPLRATSPQGEIVLVTGFATLDTAIAALQAGAFAFILKSFRPEELISTVAQAIEKTVLKREREEYMRRYQALVDAADVLILGLDAAGNVTLWNRKLAALTGVPRDRAEGQPFGAQVLDENDRKKAEQAIADVRASEGATEFEIAMNDAIGAIRRVRWHLSFVKRPSGQKKDLLYGIGLDVTERRALERRAADAEALNAMAPLALGLAHEIRNPLNAAVLELHLLGRSIEKLPDETRDPMKRRVSIVESEIKRLERLLSEFLELARPRAPQRERVDLARVLGDVVELEEEALAAHRVALERDLKEGEAIAIGDVEKLKQVALNLVVNALDVMPDGGRLRVASGASDGEVWMAIGDSGPGVDPTILAEIFDPFFTTKAAGTGLGLAIVRKIVDQHAGRVAVDTKKGEGTTVRVVFPRA